MYNPWINCSWTQTFKFSISNICFKRIPFSHKTFKNNIINLSFRCKTRDWEIGLHSTSQLFSCRWDNQSPYALRVNNLGNIIQCRIISLYMDFYAYKGNIFVSCAYRHIILQSIFCGLFCMFCVSVCAFIMHFIKVLLQCIFRVVCWALHAE